MGFRHGIYFTCIRVHNHGCHVFGGPFRRCFRYHFFCNLLDIIVDGGDDGIPIFCVIILMDNGICAIVKDERPPRGSFHIAVVISFQSPLCVTTGKTNQMAGGTVQRIRAFTAFFKINTFQVHGFQFFFHTALNTFHKVFPMVIHIQFPCFWIHSHILFQCVVIQFREIFAKSCQCLFLFFWILLCNLCQLQGVQCHVIHGGTDGKNLIISVQNTASVGRDGNVIAVDLLVLCCRFILRTMNNFHIQHSAKHQGKCRKKCKENKSKSSIRPYSPAGFSHLHQSFLNRFNMDAIKEGSSSTTSSAAY